MILTILQALAFSVTVTLTLTGLFFFWAALDIFGKVVDTLQGWIKHQKTKQMKG